ncbi:MAG TPA: RHS repeat-associated core domain-containing protein [Thermoanaerobaculia bacterium]|nr:RHS repeat-associated core domain-containing protein [Thermoanaerobaculia bacterium]
MRHFRSLGVIPALLVTAATLFLPTPAFSTCSVTLNAGAPSNGSLSYTATSSGQCGATSVSVSMNGSQVGSKSCPSDTTCTLTGTINTVCLKTGTYTLTASGGCGRTDGSSCAIDTAGTASTSFSINTTPTVSLDIPDPDSQGNTTVTINYSFPNTDNFAHRRVRFTTDGGTTWEETFDNESGTWQFPLSLTCQKGVHTYQAIAFACGRVSPTTYPTDPAFIAHSAVITKSVNPKPAVSVSYADSAALDGTGTATVMYDFPNTNSFAHRRVRLTLDGSLLREDTFDAQSGTFTVPVNLACAAPGSHVLVATAWACGGVSPTRYPTDPDYIAQDSTTVNTDHTPAVGVALDTSVSPPVAVVNYSFPRTNSSTQRLVELVWASTGQVLAETRPATMTGTWQVALPACLPGTDHDLLLVHAVACGDETAESSTPIALPQCDPSCSTQCPSCVGSPIRVTNGNMRLTDRDPLPGTPIAPLARTFDSQLTTTGVFGRGWTSVFDTLLRSWGDQDGREIVSFSVDPNDRVVFARRAGVYRQIWPAGTRMTGTLTYDGAAATFAYREAGAAVARVFRASDGRLIALRSLAGQYEVRITYVNGKPSRVEDSRGTWSWTIALGTSGTIDTISVDGQPSLVWTYGYDGSGNLATVNVSGSAWRVYTYGSAGILAARDGGGRLIEGHTYDAAGHALSSSGAADDVTNIEYNASGARVPGETVTRVSYASGRVTDYFSRFAGGTMRTVEIRGSCNCGTDDAVYAYDGKGHIVREQNARGYVTSSSYDAASGNVVSTSTAMRPAMCDPATAADRCRLDPAALASAALIGTPATLTIAYAYGDSQWPDKPTVTTTTSVVPGQVRTESRSYHPTTGEVVSLTISGWRPGTQPVSIDRSTSTSLYGDPPQFGNGGPFAPAFDPGGSFSSAWFSLPQPSGLTRSVDGARTDVADVTSFVYYPIDASVPATLRGHLAAMRNAAGHITRFEGYDAFGNVTRMVDSNGVATESTFDALGRPATTTLRGVSGCDTAADALCATDLVTTRTYNPAGPLASMTQPGGGSTTYEYDDRGRMSATMRAVAPGAYERIEYDYDPASGKKSAERVLSGQPGSWTVKRFDAFHYDSFGRLAEVDHPDGTKIVYAYDPAGNISSVKDERHTTPNTVYSYDAANRLSVVTQTLASAPGGQIVTSYTYDVQGNLAGVTDPNDNVTNYVYDDFGLLLQQNSPVTGVTAYSYDAAGDLTSTTDANGATTVRTYDALGRVLTAISSCGSTEQVTWTYDDSTPAKFGIGRLASMTDPSGLTGYAYERRGLLRSEDRMIGPWPSATPFAYDADGNRTRTGTLYTTYDAADRPASMVRRDCPTCQALSIVTSASYLPFGPETQIVFGNGSQQTKSYDNRYRIAENKLTGAGAVTIADYMYQTDAGGNITSIHDVVNGAFDRSFGYDDLNRLTAANTGAALWGTGSYAYDRMGNLLSATVGNWSGAFTFVGSTPRLADVEYDAAGNSINGFFQPYSEDTTVGPGPTRAYSCRNLLGSVTGPSGLESGVQCPPNCGPPPRQYTYQYDGRGVRVHADANGTPIDYVYTPELQLRLVHDAADTRELAWFNGHAVAQISQQSLTPRFTFTDHLGTPLLQTDASAQVVWRAEYEPYGRLYALRAGDSEEEQPLRLPGQEIAAHSALGPGEHYNIFRWYQSGWGRYTQADPLFGGSMDFTHFWIETNPATQPYSYAAGNPIQYEDSLGLYVAPGPIIDACVKTKNPYIVAGGVAIALLIVAANSYNDGQPTKAKLYKGACNACHDNGHDDECDAQLADEQARCFNWWGGSKKNYSKLKACNQSAMWRWIECKKGEPPHTPLSPTPFQY